MHMYASNSIEVRLLTAMEAASRLRMKVKKIHSLVRLGKLACIQISPKDRKFTEAQLHEFIEMNTVPNRKPIDSIGSGRIPYPKKGGSKSKSVEDSARAQLKEEMRSWR